MHSCTSNLSPYVQHLLAQSSDCFGSYSSEDPTCTGCVLSQVCLARQYQELSILSRVRVAPSKPAPSKPTPPQPLPPTPTPAPPTPAAPARANKPTTLSATNDGNCVFCGAPYTAGDKMAFLPGSGLMHPTCYQASKLKG